MTLRDRAGDWGSEQEASCLAPSLSLVGAEELGGKLPQLGFPLFGTQTFRAKNSVLNKVLCALITSLPG